MYIIYTFALLCIWRTKGVPGPPVSNPLVTSSQLYVSQILLEQIISLGMSLIYVDTLALIVFSLIKLESGCMSCAQMYLSVEALKCVFI